MGSTKPVLRRVRRLMKKPLRRCSRRLTGLNRDWLPTVNSPAIRCLRRTFACSPHSYVSTRSTTGTLSATCGVSSIIPIYGPDLFQTLGIGVTVNLDHAKRHYYESHRTKKPTGIVPKGPILDFTVPHDRAALARVSTAA